LSQTHLTHAAQQIDVAARTDVASNALDPELRFFHDKAVTTLRQTAVFNTNFLPYSPTFVCEQLINHVRYQAKSSRAAKIDAFLDECLARDPSALEKGAWSASACARASVRWLVTAISTGKWIYR
jgi:hypothetical protein